MHPATVTISLIGTESNPKTMKVSGIFSVISEISFAFFNVRYKLVNRGAQYVAVNAKAIQACVRSKRYWVYEVNGKSVRSQQVKAYAVNARKCLELCLSLPGGETYCFCFYGILSTYMSVRVSVRHKIVSAL